MISVAFTSHQPLSPPKDSMCGKLVRILFHSKNAIWYLQIGRFSTVHKTPASEAISFVDPTLMG